MENTMPVFIGDLWSKPEDVWESFRIDPPEGEILVAFYSYEDYSGSSYVLFRCPDGTLLENEAGHCSCNGLEDSWSPGEVSVEYLENRLENGEFPGGYWEYGKPYVNSPEVVETVQAAIKKVRDGYPN